MIDIWSVTVCALSRALSIRMSQHFGSPRHSVIINSSFEWLLVEKTLHDASLDISWPSWHSSDHGTHWLSTSCYVGSKPPPQKEPLYQERLTLICRKQWSGGLSLEAVRSKEYSPHLASPSGPCLLWRVFQVIHSTTKIIEALPLRGGLQSNIQPSTPPRRHRRVGSSEDNRKTN